MDNSDRATSAETLSRWVRDACDRTVDLIADLDDDQLIGPKLPTINPLAWEIGHAAFFQEHWVLRHAFNRKPILRDSDELYDSIGIDHDVRWDLPLLSREDTLKYIRQVRDSVLELLDQGPLTACQTYFVKLSVFHEDMHTEAFSYTRQTLAYPQPTFLTDAIADQQVEVTASGECGGDVEIPGGTFRLGAPPETPFVFDNEKWAHDVRIEPFVISQTAVSQGQFAEFVNDDGYQRPELWTEDGWQWREQTGADGPIYWKQDTDGGWLRRHFDQWLSLEPCQAMIHVNWYEAGAYCRWAGRRLPTEAEWELAASGANKLHYPWGENEPTSEHVNMDWRAMGTMDVAALAAGDSDYGCRQMLGNVWEWTATTFEPFPKFVADPYKEYSRSCFGDCRVLRGGAWTTRSRLIRNTWRNFYKPDRRDVWAGFRTCAM